MRDRQSNSVEELSDASFSLARFRVFMWVRSMLARPVLIYGICLLGFVPGFSVAQVSRGDTLPSALADIKQAGGICPRDGTDAKGTVNPKVDEYPVDLSCAISAPDALSLLGKPETVVVDTRSANEFGEFQIDGSLNLSASALRHKTYLRDARLVLVGNGKSERVLYEACAELKKNGFKQVHVLRGGLAAWLSYGQPISGKTPGINSLVQLSPAELWAESQFDANLILVSSRETSIQNQVPSAILISQLNKDVVISGVERRQKERKKTSKAVAKENSLASVVLVATSDLSADKISDFRQALKPVPLLVYSDTAESFNRYLATQKATWAAQAKGPKQPKCGL